MDDLIPAPQGYELVGRIGRGASSVVWQARQLGTGEPVALKVLDADVSDADAMRRFEREREAMSAVAAHPNIVTIVDAGVQNGRPWLAMELCRRGSLAAYSASAGAPDATTGLRALARLAAALAVAHDAGVVHCDIKPANVMLTDGGEPALGDFGIARVSVGRATTTTVGGFSLDHVAPELLDDGKRTPRSDVYSLGTTIWELMAGRPPFRHGDDVSVGAVLTRILRQPLPESPRVPGEVLDLLQVMAAKSPEDRPGSMREVGDAVRAVAARLEVDLDGPAFPPITAAELELATTPLAGAGDGGAAEATRLRPSTGAVPAPAEEGARPHRRMQVVAAAGVVVLLVAGFGVTRFIGTGAAGTQVVASQVGPVAQGAETGEPDADVPVSAAPTTASEAPPAPPVPGPDPAPAEVRTPTGPVERQLTPEPQLAQPQPLPHESQGNPSQGNPSQGNSSQGNPSQGNPSQGNPSQGNPSQGSSSQRKRDEKSADPAPTTGDLDDDGDVDCDDLAELQSNWNGSGRGDLNEDGTVDTTDMSILLSNWSGEDNTSC